MTRRHLISRLGGDARGAAVVEFALMLPVGLVLLLGSTEMVYQGYMHAMVEGELQRVSRAAALQGGGQNVNTFDTAVRTAIRRLNNRATVDFERLNYGSFLAAGPERFDDLDGDKTYDRNECFTDTNANNVWDAKPRGSTGVGGANDVVAYSVTVSYPRLFPATSLMGLGPRYLMKSRTFLKNQPYDQQGARTTTLVCPR